MKKLKEFINNIFRKKEPEKEIRPEAKTVGGLVPIVTRLKYNVNINDMQLKMMLIRKMEKDLINYVYFSEEEYSDGVKLIKARIDVVRRDNIEI